MRAEAFVLVTPGKPLERRTIDVVAKDDEAIVEVIACGLCHTDLGFADGSVAPRHALPLVLGHEIVGRVVEAPASRRSLSGKRVIVPAVMPCGACAFCAAGRANACPSQKMPGNDIDGGFATHVAVPAKTLVPIEDAPARVDVRELSVVADAVSTAHQAIRRSGLQAGDVAFVVGAGGVGGYLAQLAHAIGARVVAFDVSKQRLDMLAHHGPSLMINVEGRAPKDVKREAQAAAREWGVPSLRWRIFECSGTPAGQSLAFALLGQAATLLVVGYTTKTVELRLSNAMAFDATIHGSWGCPPDGYPEVLRRIYAGEIAITPFVEHAPMSRINEVMDDMAHHRLARRVIFDPRA